MLTFLVATVCLLVGFALGCWRARLRENRGEGAVRRELTSQFPSSEYHLLNNVTLAVEDGTTQIDHVLVSRFGVFVLESKHYSGWLYATSALPQWTQVFPHRRYKFQNPIHQNRKHVAAVVGLLDFLPAGAVHSVVVFTGEAVFKTPRPPGVFALPALAKHISSFNTEVLSGNRMQLCVGRLECCRRALTQQTDVEHVAHLRRKFGDVN